MPLLDWVNRNQAEETATSVPYHLLKFEKAYGDTEQAKENLIIQGDNLQALKALLPLYGGQVKCIFIDPPYNTQSAFEHYDDKLEHAQWLSMMYPRLQLLKELLAEDGSIWITLDDNEAHYMKVLCDEVFTRKNFVSSFIWRKVDSPNENKVTIAPDHDHILCYAKNISKVSLIKQYDEGILDSYRAPDDNSDRPYRDRLLKKNGKNSLRKDRPTMFFAIKDPDGNEILPIHDDGREARWALGYDSVMDLITSNQLIWKKREDRWVPYTREYAPEYPVKPWHTIWNDLDTTRQTKAHHKNIFSSEIETFETPKPEDLIGRILTITTCENEIILDSFLGSGTTAAVAHKMGRRYIGIEMGEHAKTHVIPRLERVIEGEQGGVSSAVNWQGGGGFSFYTLGNPVFDDLGSLNTEVKFKDLASYIWWLQTKTALNQTESFDTPYLGTHDGVAYYLLYNGILGDRRPNGGNVLTLSILNYLNECHAHEGKRVVIGEASRLGDARLEALDIEFKQIPYSLYGNQAQ